MNRSVFPIPARRKVHHLPQKNKKKTWLLHCLILRFKLPVHGEGEAEQAARFSALPHDIVAVQIESGQLPTSQEADDEQWQWTGNPGLHGLWSSTKTPLDLWEESPHWRSCRERLSACRGAECCPLAAAPPTDPARITTPQTGNLNSLPNFYYLVSKSFIRSR